MNKILEIIKKYNGTLISRMEDSESVIYDEEFIILRNGIKNHFCVFEFDHNEVNTEEIVAYIEKCCNENEMLRNIKPQFIYAIVILKTPCIGEKLHKKIIEIEENEYFCKKYVFYYNDNEVNTFEAWAKNNKKNSFNELIRIESNNKTINKKNTDSIALKFMLRILIKFIFVKVDLEYKGEVSFENELLEQLKKIKNNYIKSNIHKFNEEGLGNLMSMSLDEAVDSYLSSFREV
ncbi:ABC-three component system middle component 1 [uncultured Clostridium sp.]|uniref:ABC-three component system middle component 1 n=1 Tax=uncultured Clostridium sp. TaxID=59620 RepID=UPI0025E9AC63|nr:ABC-three component system middle component 1 [uncultured Clostridium sp.]